MSKRTFINLLDSDDEEISSSSSSSSNEIPKEVIEMAQGGDPRRIVAFWSLLPRREQFHPPLSTLLLKVLRASNHTDIANVITSREPPFYDKRIGDPYPFTRLECFLFARYFDDLLTKVDRPASVFLDLPSRVTMSATASASDMACLLDARSWVTDGIVDTFGALLEMRYDDIAFLPSIAWSVPRETVFQKYFVTKHAGFIKEKRYLFAPVHSVNHWTFLVFKINEASCRFYNSYKDDWQTFSGDSQKKFFKDLVDWLKTFLPVYERVRRVTPVRVREYPHQLDATSCAIYTMQGMRCIASANHTAPFLEYTWDDKADLLRFDIFLSLMNKRVNPLITSPDLRPLLRDPASDDVLDDLPSLWFRRCAECSREGDCLVCLPWEVAFCDEKCQEDYAQRHQLKYL